jgi:hypothetical protein
MLFRIDQMRLKLQGPVHIQIKKHHVSFLTKGYQNYA